jgi:flagellar basal-body rod protein FlgB
MLGRLFSSGSLPSLELMLRFATERQRTLAGNIANVETVGYQTLDLSESGFRQELARVFHGHGLSPDALRAGPADDAGALKAGGNNVDLDIEMAKMIRNNALHSTAAALLAHQYSLLREAISGHVIS